MVWCPSIVSVVVDLKAEFIKLILVFGFSGHYWNAFTNHGELSPEGCSNCRRARISVHKLS